MKTGQIIHDIIYTFHMLLFFMIAGYIAGNGNHSERKDKFSSIIIKNVISLYIPYLFLDYIYWFERLLADKLLGINLERPLKISVKEMIELCYIGDGIAWFLLSLLLIKLLFEILDRHVPEFVVFTAFSLLFWLDLGAVANLLAWGVVYFIGHLIGKYGIDQITRGQRPLVSIMCINIVIIGTVFLINKELNFIVRFLIGIPVFILLMLWPPVISKENIISFCGRHSMVVYMMHGFSNYVCYFVLSKFIEIPYILLLVIIVLQILISYVVFWLYSNVRWLYWVKFIFYPYGFVRKGKRLK